MSIPLRFAQVGETIETEEILRLHDRLLEQVGDDRFGLHAVHIPGPTTQRIVIKLSGRR